MDEEEHESDSESKHSFGSTEQAKGMFLASNSSINFYLYIKNKKQYRNEVQQQQIKKKEYIHEPPTRVSNVQSTKIQELL